jgi:hypothetical protein
MTTNNDYIVPHFITLANTIQQKYRQEPHALAIAEYAQNVLLVRGRNYTR